MNTENNDMNTAETSKKGAAKTVKKTIYRKLLAIQTGLKVPKNLHNKTGNFNYRNAEGILEAVKPFLLEQECVLLLSDDIEVIGSTVHSQTDEKGVKTVKEVARRYVKATARLIDCATGDEIETYAYANECEHANMSGDQCTGTASSYARKYCLNALFLLDDTKDSDTDEMKNIEDGGQQTNAPARNTGWGKTPPSAPANKTSWNKSASASASKQEQQGQQTQPARNGSRTWGKG